VKKTTSSRSQKGGSQVPVAAAGMALFVLATQQFIMAYDTTAMNVAISQIVKDLNTTLTGVQSAITLYALVMASLMMVGSALGDVFGRKRLFIIGALIYGTGALVTSLSQSLTGFIIGWSLLEGIGAAFVLPVLLSLVIINFAEGAPRTKAFTLIGALAAVGATLGPLFGGLLTTYISWRISFAIEVLVVLVVVAFSGNLRDSDKRESLAGFDVLGAVLSALGFTIIVSGLLLISSYGFFTARHDLVIGNTILFPQGGLSPVFVFVLIGLGVLALFAWWEARRIRNGQEPLIRPVLLMFRAVRVGVIEMALLVLVQSGIMFVVPVYTQISLEYTAIQSGLAILPMSIAVIVISVLLPRINDRWMPRTIIRAGFLIMATGCFFLAVNIAPLKFELRLASGLILAGIGIGLITALIQSIVLSALRADYVGQASGLARSLSFLGSSFGTALAGGILISVIISNATTLTHQSTVLDAGQQEQLIVALEGDVQAVSNSQMTELAADLPADVQTEIVNINSQARDAGLGAAMVMLGVFSLLALGISFRLPGLGMPPDPVLTQ
jgi:MFS family permease